VGKHLFEVDTEEKRGTDMAVTDIVLVEWNTREGAVGGKTEVSGAAFLEVHAEGILRVYEGDRSILCLRMAENKAEENGAKRDTPDLDARFRKLVCELAHKCIADVERNGVLLQLMRNGGMRTLRDIVQATLERKLSEYGVQPIELQVEKIEVEAGLGG